PDGTLAPARPSHEIVDHARSRRGRARGRRDPPRPLRRGGAHRDARPVSPADARTPAGPRLRHPGRVRALGEARARSGVPVLRVGTARPQLVPGRRAVPRTTRDTMPDELMTVLRPDGSVSRQGPDLPREFLHRLHSAMLKTRALDEKAMNLQR